MIITARKRSMGQGNVLNLCVSLFTAGGGLASQYASQVMWPRGSASQGSGGGGLPNPPGGTPPGLPMGGSLHPGGGWADPPPSRYMGYYGTLSTSRRYASYWNVFLLFTFSNKKQFIQRIKFPFETCDLNGSVRGRVSSSR